MEVGCRRSVRVYFPDVRIYEVFDDVLVRANVDDHHPQMAYFPVPYRATFETLAGHVKICHVLERRPDNGDDDDDDDDDNNNLLPPGDDYEQTIVRFEITERLVAVKVCLQHKMDDLRARGNPEDPLRETALMQHIGTNVPHVATCIDVLRVAQNDSYNIVMPYFGGGDLFDHLFSTGQGQRFTEVEASPLFRGIMEGLLALHHEKRICHHDLSIENIILDTDGHGYIIDFGMALRVPYATATIGISQEGQLEEEQETQRCLIKPDGRYGKNSYMSPEVYACRDAFDSEASDVWSMGCVLWCMMTGHGSYRAPLRTIPQFRFLSRECVHLMQNMLQVDPRLRLSINEVLAHPWMQGRKES